MTDDSVYDAIVSALRDESYAVEAAAAKEPGRSGKPRVFEILQADVALRQDVYVVEGVLAGIAATRDPRAAANLLGKARPGVQERIRLSALAGLGALEGAVAPEHAEELTATVHAALEDPFLPVRQAGEQLAGEFHLVVFEPEIRKDLTAPFVMQRELAQEVLEQLQAPQR